MDASAKIIFDDPILCSQFLRGYTEIVALKDVQPEDIEDVTERFVHMFTEERNSDVIKRVHLKGKKNPFYIISLIEHKSKVDYNVVMQILRYMVFIWEDYEKEQERLEKGSSMVQIKDYTNLQLMEKHDELSILMMINKLKKSSDFSKWKEEVDLGYLEDTTEKTPEYLLGIMAHMIELLLKNINVPKEEAESVAGKVKERDMAGLFDHFEAYDVQATRAEARKLGLEEGRKLGNELIYKR